MADVSTLRDGLALEWLSSNYVEGSTYLTDSINNINLEFSRAPVLVEDGLLTSGTTYAASNLSSLFDNSYNRTVELYFKVNDVSISRYLVIAPNLYLEKNNNKMSLRNGTGTDALRYYVNDINGNETLKDGNIYHAVIVYSSKKPYIQVHSKYLYLYGEERSSSSYPVQYLQTTSDGDSKLTLKTIRVWTRALEVTEVEAILAEDGVPEEVEESDGPVIEWLSSNYEEGSSYVVDTINNLKLKFSQVPSVSDRGIELAGNNTFISEDFTHLNIHKNVTLEISAYADFVGSTLDMANTFVSLTRKANPGIVKNHGGLNLMRGYVYGLYAYTDNNVPDTTTYSVISGSFYNSGIIVKKPENTTNLTHIVIAQRGNTFSITDGEQTYTTEHNGSAYLNALDYVFSVFRSSYSNSNSAEPDHMFDGALNTVRVWNRCLSEEEITDLFVVDPEWPELPEQPEEPELPEVPVIPTEEELRDHLVLEWLGSTLTDGENFLVDTVNGKKLTFALEPTLIDGCVTTRVDDINYLDFTAESITAFDLNPTYTVEAEFTLDKYKEHQSILRFPCGISLSSEAEGMCLNISGNIDTYVQTQLNTTGTYHVIIHFDNRYRAIYFYISNGEHDVYERGTVFKTSQATSGSISTDWHIDMHTPDMLVEGTLSFIRVWDRLLTIDEKVYLINKDKNIEMPEESTEPVLDWQASQYVSGSPDWLDSISNKTISFANIPSVSTDGIDVQKELYLISEDLADLQISRAYTVEFIFRLDNIADCPTIAYFSDKVGIRNVTGPKLYVDFDDNGTYALFLNPCNSELRKTSVSGIKRGINHVFITKSNSYAYIYINGIYNRVYLFEEDYIHANTNVLQYLSNNTEPSNFVGSYNRIRVWNRWLSKAEIDELLKEGPIEVVPPEPEPEPDPDPIEPGPEEPNPEEPELNIADDEAYNAESRCIEQKVVIHFANMEPLEVTKDNYLVTTSMLEEAHSINSSKPLGGVTSNELSVELLNEDSIFSPTNKNSPYYGKMQKGTKVELFIRPVVEGSNYDWSPLGVYYVTDWSAVVTGLIATLTANDKIYSVLETDISHTRVQRDVTYQQFYSDVFVSLNIDAIVDSALQETLKYAYVLGTCKDLLTELGVGALADCFCNHSGSVIVSSLLNERPLRAVLTDANQLIEANIEQSISNGYDGAEIQYSIPQESEIDSLFTQTELSIDVGVTNLNDALFTSTPVYNVCYTKLIGAPDTTVSNLRANAKYLNYTLSNLDKRVDNAKLTVYGTTIDKSDVVLSDAGSNLLSISNIYIQNEEYAKVVRKHIRAYAVNILPILEISVRGNPNLELCDKIRVVSAKYNLDYTGIIIKQTFDYDGSLSSKIMLLNYDIIKEVQ